MRHRNNVLFRLAAWLVCLMLLATPCAAAGSMVLPDDILTIEAEAFLGTAAEDVWLPDGVRTIGARAFANSALSVIYLPESLTSIDPTAFSGCDGMLALVEAGSYAEWWCGYYGVAYESISYDEPADVLGVYCEDISAWNEYGNYRERTWFKRGETYDFTVETTLNAGTLRVTDETGAVLGTFAADGNSYDEQRVRVWRIPLRFTVSKDYRLTFEAGLDDESFFGETVGYVASVSVGQSWIEGIDLYHNLSAYGAGSPVDFYVELADGASYLRAYDTDGTLLKTWSGLYGSERVSCVIAEAGQHTVTFRASKDGSTYTGGPSLNVNIVEEPRVLYAFCDRAMGCVGSALAFNAETTANAASLALFDESGRRVKTWYGGSDDSDTLVWEVEWTPTSAYAGEHTFTLKAGTSSGAYPGNGIQIPLAISAQAAVFYGSLEGDYDWGVPKYVRGTEATVTVTTSANAKKVALFGPGGNVIASSASPVYSDNDSREWELDCTFDTVGLQPYTVKASASGSAYDVGRTWYVQTYAKPEILNDFYEAPMVQGRAGEGLSISLITPIGTQRLRIYENGRTLKTMTADGDGGYWYVDLSFLSEGAHHLTAKASVDGSTYGPAFDFDARVYPDYSHLIFNAEPVGTEGLTAVFELYVDSMSNKLRMLDASGAVAKRWTWGGDDTPLYPVITSYYVGDDYFEDGEAPEDWDGNIEVERWKARYTFPAPGTYWVTFQASEGDGKPFDMGITLSVTVGEGDLMNYTTLAGAEDFCGTLSPACVDLPVVADTRTRRLRAYTPAADYGAVWFVPEVQPPEDNGEIHDCLSDTLLTDAGYTLFGVGVGMTRDEALAALTSCGLVPDGEYCRQLYGSDWKPSLDRWAFVNLGRYASRYPLVEVTFDGDLVASVRAYYERGLV